MSVRSRRTFRAPGWPSSVFLGPPRVYAERFSRAGPSTLSIHVFSTVSNLILMGDSFFIVMCLG
jgi:hypothetical protein